jgi:hypothetical protein
VRPTVKPADRDSNPRESQIVRPLRWNAAAVFFLEDRSLHSSRRAQPLRVAILPLRVPLVR